ncbi:MAG: DUF3090 family protein [Chloroflexi bacterium]|nr:DUF3090 family protein [Chloroflexota bacterium]
MARRTYLFDPPDRFIAGTIGQPGNRTFFLQARDGARIVSVSLEKVQVAALAERLGRLLFELDNRGIVTLDEAGTSSDVAPLDEPLAEAFRAGTLTLGWDGGRERILIEARAQGEEEDETEDDPGSETDLEHLLADDDDADAPDVLRVHLTAQVARAFVERALRVVGSGRPPCPLCGNPLDPQGHICPRRNGHYVN